MTRDHPSQYWFNKESSGTGLKYLFSVQVLNATRQVIDKIPVRSTPGSLSTLFLQLTVDDMGICVPVASVSQVVSV